MPLKLWFSTLESCSLLIQFSMLWWLPTIKSFCCYFITVTLLLWIVMWISDLPKGSWPTDWEPLVWSYLEPYEEKTLRILVSSSQAETRFQTAIPNTQKNPVSISSLQSTCWNLWEVKVTLSVHFLFPNSTHCWRRVDSVLFVCGPDAGLVSIFQHC